MKKTLLFSALLSLCLTAICRSQEYYPLLGNPSWVGINYLGGEQQEPDALVIHEGVDVVINAVTYKKFIDSFRYPGDPYYYAYLREDVSQQKVYSLINGAERLIYDFSLENSDTFAQDNHTYIAVVDYVEVNGTQRKRIVLHDMEFFDVEDYNQTWIEGVGGTSNPLRPNHNAHSSYMNFHDFIFTLCAFQDGVHIYGEPDCTEALGTSGQSKVSPTVSIYPNPFAATLTIQRDKAFENLTVKVYDAVGQLVREVSHQSGQKILLNRGSLAGGLYVAQLFENGQLLETRKLMVQ